MQNIVSKHINLPVVAYATKFKRAKNSIKKWILFWRCVCLVNFLAVYFKQVGPNTNISVNASKVTKISHQWFKKSIPNSIEFIEQITLQTVNEWNIWANEWMNEWMNYNDNDNDSCKRILFECCYYTSGSVHMFHMDSLFIIWPVCLHAAACCIQVIVMASLSSFVTIFW